MAKKTLIKATYKLGDDKIVLTELPIKSETLETIVIQGYQEGCDLHNIQPKNSYVKVENLNKPYAYGATKENYICWISPEHKKNIFNLMRQMVMDDMNLKTQKLKDAVNKIKTQGI